MQRVVVLALSVILSAVPALGATREVTVPLRQGKLHVADLSAAVCKEVHLPALPVAVNGDDIALDGPRAPILLASVNGALGDAGHAAVLHDAVVLQLDTEKLPPKPTGVLHAIRDWTARTAPETTAKQARHYGLFTPQDVDTKRPLVILTHGLDSGREDCLTLGDLLTHDGFQVGYFCYPADQPIAESAEFFAAGMRALHEAYPSVRIDVVAHSMGGLVARDYIEGLHYIGGVDHLILIGAPNYGSHWARYRIGLGMQDHYRQWRSDPEWSPVWAITDGLGEAGSDLTPGSPFLKHLNARPRREGVKYTIVAGSKSTVNRVKADCMESLSHCLPARVMSWWGLRQCSASWCAKAAELRDRRGNSDGVVRLESAKLKGVADVVILPADHIALFMPVDNQPPAAWRVVEDRLTR